MPFYNYLNDPNTLSLQLHKVFRQFLMDPSKRTARALFNHEHLPIPLDSLRKHVITRTQSHTHRARTRNGGQLSAGHDEVYLLYKTFVRADTLHDLTSRENMSHAERTLLFECVTNGLDSSKTSEWKQPFISGNHSCTAKIAESLRTMAEIPISNKITYNYKRRQKKLLDELTLSADEKFHAMWSVWASKQKLKIVFDGIISDINIMNMQTTSFRRAVLHCAFTLLLFSNATQIHHTDTHGTTLSVINETPIVPLSILQVVTLLCRRLRKLRILQ